MRYFNGEVQIQETDVMARGFGIPWSHTRTYSNQMAENVDQGNGWNWISSDFPYFKPTTRGPNGVILFRNLYNLRYFLQEFGSDDYYSQFGDLATLIHDADAHSLILKEPDGTVFTFHDVEPGGGYRHGGFVSMTDPGGNTLSVTNESATRILEVQRSVTVESVTERESFLYDYFDAESGQFDRLEACTLRRQIGSSAWKNVVRSVYSYYGSGDSNGSSGDLRTVTKQVWDEEEEDWADVSTQYYRYYVGTGYTQHNLKFYVGPEAFVKLTAAAGDPFAASDSTVGMFADNYFEYDQNDRVSLERTYAGGMTITFAYDRNRRHTDTQGNPTTTDPNIWIFKTTESLPDGSQRVCYANHAGQTMLYVVVDETAQWCRFRKYDEGGREVLVASPSAVTGYDEDDDDLLGFNAGLGTYEYLRDHEGLIFVTEFYDGSESTEENAAPAGYLKAQKIRKGQLGTPIPQQSLEYDSHAVGEVTVYPISKESRYPDGSTPVDTDYEYTFHEDSLQVLTKTTDLPAISADQHGSGNRNSIVESFDILGYRTELVNENNVVTEFTYDIATGGLIRQVDDADNPGELVSDFQVDNQGRQLQSLGPAHEIDLDGTATTVRTATWTVYDDAGHTVRSGQGYATGSAPDYDFTLINPVSIRIMDHDNRPLDDVIARRSSTSGKLLPTDSFPQSSYLGWTNYQYTECCLLASQRVYHDIPSSGSGSSGTNYDQTDYGYDVMKRRNRVVSPGGTITFSVFDVRNLTKQVFVGTNDDGATQDDPTGGGTDPENNMVLVTVNVYDDSEDGGDGNLTQQTQSVDDTVDRVTSYSYDFRNRLIATDGEEDFYETRTYDNLNNLVRVERYDTTAEGNLVSRVDTHFDDLNRVYRTVRWGIDPASGADTGWLADNTWYDGVGNVIQFQPAGSRLYQRSRFNRLNRPTITYDAYGNDEDYNAIRSVPLVVLKQVEYEYDEAMNLIQEFSLERYHNAPASQTGPLRSGMDPKGRAQFQDYYPDALGRLQASVNYGTRHTSGRPTTIPSSSDTALVSSQTYTEAGELYQTIDPAGMVTEFAYDAAGRRVQVVENRQPGSSSSSSSSSSDGCEASEDTNRTTTMSYSPDGLLAALTAWNLSTGNQTTVYSYGTTLDDSDVAASVLLRSVAYPDSSSSSDEVFFTYNRQAQRTSLTDQNGNVHDYDYDLLGRPVQDRVTTLGAGIDGTVRRLQRTYEVRGLVQSLSSVDNAAVGSGTVLNEVQFTYNQFSQVRRAYQAVDGTVNTSTTPRVEYNYDTSDYRARPWLLKYPSGRQLIYTYGEEDSIDDSISRIAGIQDDLLVNVDLVNYSYLGLGTCVQAEMPEPDLLYTLASLDGSDDPDTHDIYTGLDRFGRIKDLRWWNTDAETDLSQVKYGYDRASNRIWRRNPLAPDNDQDWLYSYDGSQRLKEAQRGTLNSGHSSLDTRNFAQCWTLDETGNWQGFKQSDTGSSWTLQQQRTANTANEITSINATTGKTWGNPRYDKNGNMTWIPRPESPQPSWATFTPDQWDTFTADEWAGFQSAGAMTATYDAWNRLVKVTGAEGTLQENGYDARNYRITRKDYADGTLDETRQFYYSNEWQVLEERLAGSSTPDRQYVWGIQYVDDLVFRDRSVSSTLDERLYACQDANWNVTALVDRDGEVTERFEYDPYGKTYVLDPEFEPREESDYGWETTYCGYRWDQRTGLYQVRNRAYSPVTGTWVQRDPAGYLMGANLYQYVAPLVLPDPFGLGFFGAIVGGISGAITGALAGAGTGALTGSLFLGVGAGPGAIIGGISGAISGALGGSMAGASSSSLAGAAGMGAATGAVSGAIAGIGGGLGGGGLAGGTGLAAVGGSVVSGTSTSTVVTGGVLAGTAVGTATGNAMNAGSYYATSSTSGENSYAQRGRQAHQDWDPGDGYQKGQLLPSGRKPDAVNFDTCHIKELKPNNPKAIRKGEIQLQKYIDEYNIRYPGKNFTGCVETYNP
ncbi:RHS repeat-associated core domain-containing protein [Planctomicrobium piriforme]|uniref:RHS repeat-associated core domain-containing protein n=1 Tax=Planctomicrobium piriforme TaxID=1576369 RepID=UPI001FECC07A|nr:RHS repeat-associated core domain-containing protein [Planctomicrobium piriforme]